MLTQFQSWAPHIAAGVRLIACDFSPRLFDLTRDFIKIVEVNCQRAVTSSAFVVDKDFLSKLDCLENS